MIVFNRNIYGSLKYHRPELQYSTPPDFFNKFLKFLKKLYKIEDCNLKKFYRQQVL